MKKWNRIITQAKANNQNRVQTKSTPIQWRIPMKKLVIMLLVLSSLLPTMIFAQTKETQKPKFGLTFPNIGVIWNINDRVAILPGFSISHGWSSFSSNSSNTDTSLQLNAALRFYIQEWKGLEFYLSPKYSYGWGKSELRSDIITLNGKNHSHRVSGSWGLQYPISNRLSIFGDIGIEYARNSISTAATISSSTSSKSNLVGTVGTWGLILFLK